MAKEQITPQVLVDGNDIYVVFKNASKDLQNQIKAMFSTDLVKELKSLIPNEDDTEEVVNETKAVVAKESLGTSETTDHEFESLEASDILRMSNNEALIWLADNVDMPKTAENLRCLIVAYQTSRGNIDGAQKALKLSEKAVTDGFEKNKMISKIKTHINDNIELIEGLREASEIFPKEEPLSIDWD